MLIANTLVEQISRDARQRGDGYGRAARRAEDVVFCTGCCSPCLARLGTRRRRDILRRSHRSEFPVEQVDGQGGGIGSVPIRLRQALGFAERGCTPHPARFLGPSAPNPMKIREFGALPQAGVGGNPQSTAHQAPNLR